MLSHFLYSLPHLLYLTDTEFRLVEQYEMLVKVGIAIEHKAACLHMRVTTGASGLLHIILQRIGNVVMYHQSHIFFVNTHTKSRRCDDDAHFVSHKGILVSYLIVRIHLAVEWQGFEPISR